MIWLAWRQFRIQALTAVVAFLALGALLGYTGPHVVHLYHASGIQACQASHGDCGPLIDNFTSHYSWWHGLGAFIIIIPALIGVFWGAPLLARELETGTHRLAWTQSVTRTRWLATKVVIIGVASIITAAAFSVIIALWLSPFDKVAGNRFSPGTFSQRGIVPIAYAVFAFALGVAAGALIRRLLPAMVATLVGFAAVRLVVQQWVRPHSRHHCTSPPRSSIGRPPSAKASGSCRRASSTKPDTPSRLIATPSEPGATSPKANSHVPRSAHARGDSDSTQSSPSNPRTATGPSKAGNSRSSSSSPSRSPPSPSGGHATASRNPADSARAVRSRATTHPRSAPQARLRNGEPE